MKKNFFKIIIIVIAITGIWIWMNNKTIEKPNAELIAYINHSEMMGTDAGTEYGYKIYSNGDGTYFYIKTGSDITIRGSEEEKKVSSGKIRDKSDLKKIEKDIEKDKRQSCQTYISYKIKENEMMQEYHSMKELEERLF